MKKLIIYIPILAGLLLVSSCKDIIAEDITGETPQMLLPTPGSTMTDNPVQFKWEEVEGATRYRLQVVSPSFSAIQSYALDTVVTTTNFFYSLDSNSYELKLTAMNAGYESQTLGPLHFQVDAAFNPGNGDFELVTPVDEYFNQSTQAFDGIFKWTNVDNLVNYEFTLKKGNDFNSGALIYNEGNISGVQKSLPETDFTQGDYHWRVIAHTGTADITRYASFYIDTIAPTDPPTALLPAHQSNNTSAGQITFTWQNSGSNPSMTAKVEVSSFSSFSTLINSATVEGESTVLTISSAGSYYWRVINYDPAGNPSAYSNVNFFTVN